MRRWMKRRSLVVACAAWLVLGLCSVAAADTRTDYLLKLLAESSQFRVRAQAAISLGATPADASVVDALVVALRDEHPAVRAAVASALGKLGARTAVAALEALRSDPEAPVRAEAQAALARLSGPSGAAASAGSSVGVTPSTGGPARFYVAVGRPASKAPGVDESVLEGARRFIVARVSELDGVVVAPADETASAAQAQLKKSKLTGYYLESSVTQVEERADGATRVSVSLIVATYPGRDMRAIVQGAATAMGQGGEIRRQALEGAFNGALRKLPQALR